MELSPTTSSSSSGSLEFGGGAAAQRPPPIATRRRRKRGLASGICDFHPLTDAERAWLASLRQLGLDELLLGAAQAPRATRRRSSPPATPWKQTRLTDMSPPAVAEWPSVEERLVD